MCDFWRKNSDTNFPYATVYLHVYRCHNSFFPCDLDNASASLARLTKCARKCCLKSVAETAKFLGAKFQRPTADADRSLENLVAEEDVLGYDELGVCLKALQWQSDGCDNVPIEAYRGSVHATNELFRICRMMWHSERIPPELVRGTFIMLHKKGPRDDMANYRAICLLYHSYKLLSAVVARRLMAVLKDRLPDTQAGFRPARGCRDNVCALRWFINMVLREGRQAVVTFISYSSAFDTES